MRRTASPNPSRPRSAAAKFHDERDILLYLVRVTSLRVLTLLEAPPTASSNPPSQSLRSRLPGCGACSHGEAKDGVKLDPVWGDAALTVLDVKEANARDRCCPSQFEEAVT